MFKFFKKIWERIKKMIYKGSDAIEDVYVGDSQISEVYHGSTLVYKRLHFLAAGMSYVPSHSNGSGGFVDGNGAQTATKCLCLIRSDGKAAAIPFAFYNDSVNLAPSDEQIESANWVVGDYPLNYNSGYYTGSGWVPAIAQDVVGSVSGIGWSIPSQSYIRFVRDESLVMWGWRGGVYSNQIDSAYTVSIVKGVCKIYYNGNLIKSIRA